MNTKMTFIWVVILCFFFFTPSSNFFPSLFNPLGTPIRHCVTFLIFMCAEIDNQRDLMIDHNLRTMIWVKLGAQSSKFFEMPVHCQSYYKILLFKLLIKMDKESPLLNLILCQMTNIDICLRVFIFLFLKLIYS